MARNTAVTALTAKPVSTHVVRRRKVGSAMGTPVAIAVWAARMAAGNEEQDYIIGCGLL